MYILSWYITIFLCHLPSLFDMALAVFMLYGILVSLSNPIRVFIIVTSSNLPSIGIWWYATFKSTLTKLSFLLRSVSSVPHLVLDMKLSRRYSLFLFPTYAEAFIWLFLPIYCHKVKHVWEGCVPLIFIVLQLLVVINVSVI